MEVVIHSDKKIEILEHFPISTEELFEYISEPHKMTLWLANTVTRTSSGFSLSIDFPLHSIKLDATIISKEVPHYLEFTWRSEFIMDTSLVTFTLKPDNQVTLSIVEIGEFSESRWSKAQEIHIDMWKTAITKLSNLLKED